VGTWPRPRHDAWEAIMQMERQRLQEHAQGKMVRALGYALPGESQQDLDRIAKEDQRLAQSGMVQLKSGSRVYHKHTSRSDSRGPHGQDRSRARDGSVAHRAGGAQEAGRGCAPHPHTSTLTFRELRQCEVRIVPSRSPLCAAGHPALELSFFLCTSGSVYIRKTALRDGAKRRSRPRRTAHCTVSTG